MTDNTNRPDFLIRMDEEAAQLRDRLTKCIAFLDSDASFEIDPYDRDLLMQQRMAMAAYNTYLTQRIERFEAKL